MIACGQFATATALDELAALQADHLLEIRRLAIIPRDEACRVQARLSRLLPDDLAAGLSDLFADVRLARHTPTPEVGITSATSPNVTASRERRAKTRVRLLTEPPSSDKHPRSTPGSQIGPVTVAAPVSEAELALMDFLLGRALAAILAEQRAASCADRNVKATPADMETK